MAFSEVIPFDTVRSNNLGIYQIELSNWGNVGTGADPNSVLSPEFKFPLGGISIDPESTVERGILRPAVQAGVDSSGASMSPDLPFGKDPILSGRFSFPRVKGFTGGWGIVCGGSERWGDTMTAMDGSLVPFGGAVVSPAVFVKPSLRLVMAIDAGLPIPSLTRRAPLRRRDFFLFNGPPASGDRRLLWVPILGRKNLRVTALALDAGAGGALKVHGVALGPGGQAQEFELAPNKTLNNGASASVLVNNPLCHFLHVVVDQITGARVTIYTEADD